tara:strand:+ start:2546 stop:3682 length:1137 start_codon:yes stop_codon:yes gene_type:complete
MLELKRFPTKTLGAAGATTTFANASYDQEFSGRTFDSINWRADGAVSYPAGAGAVMNKYGSYRLMGTPELNQAGEPLIRMEAVDWGYLSAYTNGSFPSYLDSTGSAGGAVTPNSYASARIKLSRLVPGSYVNANLVKAFFRGSTGQLSVVGDKIDGAQQTVRPLAEALEYNPPQNGFLRPRISQRSVAVSAADSNQQSLISVEQDLVYTGIMLSAYNGAAAAGSQTEVDGLVKSIRVDVTMPNKGTLTVIDSDWGNLRDYSCQRSGLNSTDVDNTAGTVVIPCTDKTNVKMGGALFVPAGSMFTISIDSSGTAQSPYTNVAPALGDTLRITSLAFTPVAGAGDGSVQVTNVGRAGQAGVPGRAQRTPRMNRGRRGQRG